MKFSFIILFLFLLVFTPLVLASPFGYDTIEGAFEITTLNITNLNDISDVSLAGVNNNDVLTYNAGTGTWIDQAPTAGAELDPFWSANLTAHNVTWNAGAAEALWSANLTAHNTTWSASGTDTFTPNLTAHNDTWTSIYNLTYHDAYLYVSNGTFALNTSLVLNYFNYTNNTLLSEFENDLSTTEPLWGANLTAHNDTWTSRFNQTYDDAWEYATNNTFCSIDEPLWSANLTAHNVTWSASSTDTFTPNLTAHNATWNADTNAGSECAGDTTYLSGESNCNDIDAIYWNSCDDANACGWLTAEVDPYWSANLTANNATWNAGAAETLWSDNLTAHNITWNLDTDTWNTTEDIWNVVYNSTFSLIDEPLWSANLTAHNVTWSSGGTDTFTPNLTAHNDSWVSIYNLTYHDAYLYVSNGTFAFNDTLILNYFNYTNNTLLSQFENDLSTTEPFWNANLTAHNDTWNSIFNQTYQDAWNYTTNGTFLLTTGDNATGNYNFSGGTFHVDQYLTDQGNFILNFYDDGSELFMNVSSLTDAFNIETENSKLVLFNEPAAGNDFKVLQIFSKQAADVTEFVVTKAGVAHTSYFIRSLSLAGNGSLIPTPFNCSTYANFIDCDTDLTGPDLFVLDDIETWGSVYFADGNFNVTDSGNTNTSGNVSASFYFGDGSGLTGLTLTEADPFWSANLTAHNDSWNTVFNQTYEDAWQYTINSTFAQLGEPFWSANLTANNVTWNSIFNQTYHDGWLYVTNNTFLLTTNQTLVGNYSATIDFCLGDGSICLSNSAGASETDPFWSANLTANNDTWNLITNQTYEDAWKYTTNDTFRLIDNHTFMGEVNFTGDVNISSGNLTIPQTNKICLDGDVCSQWILANSSGVYIQG